MSVGQKIVLVLAVSVLISVVLAYVCIDLLDGVTKIAVWWKSRKTSGTP